eukprot:SAG31_NODE_11511_length_1022_cov_1.282774_1_plen_51_part_01
MPEIYHPWIWEQFPLSALCDDDAVSMASAIRASGGAIRDVDVRSSMVSRMG